MPEEVTIPLSFANTIPGVSGVQDVTFQIPTESDIEAIVDEQTPPPDVEAFPGLTEEETREVLREAVLATEDIQEAAREGAEEGVENRLPEFAEGLFGPLDVDPGPLFETLEELADLLEGETGAALGIPFDTFEALLDAAAPPPGDEPAVEDVEFRTLVEIWQTQTPQLGITPQEAKDEAQRRAEAGEAPGLLVVTLFQEGTEWNPINEVLAIVHDILATLEDLPGIVEDAILSVQPVLSIPADSPVEPPAEPIGTDEQGRPQVGLFSNAVEFMQQLVDNTVDILVSDEAQENLLDAVSRFNEHEATSDRPPTARPP